VFKGLNVTAFGTRRYHRGLNSQVVLYTRDSEHDLRTTYFLYVLKRRQRTASHASSQLCYRQ